MKAILLILIMSANGHVLKIEQVPVADQHACLRAMNVKNSAPNIKVFCVEVETK